MTSGNLAEAVEWFAVHETDRRGVDGSPYEVMRRKFDLTFSEALTVCREVRKLVGPFPAPGRVSTPKSANEPRPLREVFFP